MDGQITIDKYLAGIEELSVVEGCHRCSCRSCLYWWSNRCLYGDCYDDHRAKTDPYDKVHQDKPPRTGWSSWKTDQSYWCRGGVFYPIRYCEKYVKYRGSKVKECLGALIQVFQDGYIECSILETVGCEECYRRFEEKQN